MALEIEQNQAFVSAILDGLRDAVLVVDESRQVVYANQALHRLFKLRLDPVGRELMGVVLDHRINGVIEQVLEKDDYQLEDVLVAAMLSDAFRFRSPNEEIE